MKRLSMKLVILVGLVLPGCSHVLYALRHDEPYISQMGKVLDSLELPPTYRLEREISSGEFPRFYGDGPTVIRIYHTAEPLEEVCDALISAAGTSATIEILEVRRNGQCSVRIEASPGFWVRSRFVAYRGALDVSRAPREEGELLVSASLTAFWPSWALD